MIPSVWTDFYPEFTLEETVDSFLSQDLHASEISLIHLEKLKQRGPAHKVGAQVASFLCDRGFAIPQGHLTFAGGLVTPESRDEIRRDLDLYLAMGVSNAVLHFSGGKDLPEEEQFARRLAGVRELCDYVKGTPIYLCLENLASNPQTITAERLRAIMDAVDSPNLAICLDTGHLHLSRGRGDTQQTQRQFIRSAGKDLRALHIANNNGTGDDHLMPYSSRRGVDWQEVVRALREIGYKGLFNLEILAEQHGPLEIRHAKLKFIRQMLQYMLSDEFLS